MTRVALAASVLASAGATAHAQQPARDTVVVLQRDTLVIIQRDTVFVTPTPASGAEPEYRPERELTPQEQRRARLEELRAQRGGRRYDLTPEEQRAALEEARAERRARLEELRLERAERLSRLGNVREAEHAFAYYAYPTRLLEIDFPAATLGVAYVHDGRIGAMGSVGVLTRPLSTGLDLPEARGPVRGFDIGAEFRYYVSPLYQRFPFYVGGGGSYSWAPVRYNRFIENPEGTFERIGNADATGRRIRISALVGWEFRGENGAAIDFTTGFEYHGRGVFTDNAQLARALDGDDWDNIDANRFNPALYPVMRVGIGFGKW